MRPRIIPVLLIHKRALVKTVRFKDETYIGDPINAVKIFNDKEVDELIVLDIGASTEGTPIDLQMISDLASECFMPLCYGGGIKSVEEIQKILSIGVEKIALNSSAISSFNLISDTAKVVGSQSVVVSIDIKKDWLGRNRVFAQRGMKNTGLDPVTFAKEVESRGAGEILLQSIARDGTYGGYDTELVQQVSGAVKIPVIACGGAKDLSSLRNILQNGAGAAAAGSFFVYYGPKRGILINYPTADEVGQLLLKSSEK